MDDFEPVLKVIDALNHEGVEYIVIGGVALNLQGVVRATEDLDLFIVAQPENVAKLRNALRRVWNDPEIDQITADDLCGDYPSVRYGPPDGSLYLDILTRLGELARYDDLVAEDKFVDGVKIRTATPKTMYWLKMNTVRDKDKVDAQALRRIYNEVSEP
jgi:hypothetical protein